MDRRDFIRRAAWAGAASLLGAGADAPRSRVVIARDDALAPEPNRVDAAVAERLLDAAVTRLAGAESPEAAWRSLFTSRDVVGVKVNCLAGPELSSHPALVDAVVAGLRKAGVAPSKIFIWDRTTRELGEAGFSINRRGAGTRCLGTDDLPGSGYEERLVMHRSIGSRFSRFLTRECTALVNVPVLKDHDISGVSIGMKNFFGAIDNPNKYHDGHCDPFIADLSSHPLIRDKLRLVVCDAARVQYDGGPSFKPWGAWDYRGLLVARDPVALDATGLRIIEKKRGEEGRPLLEKAGRRPKYIASAAALGLGLADADRIDTVEL